MKITKLRAEVKLSSDQAFSMRDDDDDGGLFLVAAVKLLAVDWRWGNVNEVMLTSNPPACNSIALALGPTPLAHRILFKLPGGHDVGAGFANSRCRGLRCMCARKTAHTNTHNTKPLFDEDWKRPSTAAKVQTPVRRSVAFRTSTTTQGRMVHGGRVWEFPIGLDRVDKRRNGSPGEMRRREYRQLDRDGLRESRGRIVEVGGTKQRPVSRGLCLWLAPAGRTRNPRFRGFRIAEGIRKHRHDARGDGRRTKVLHPLGVLVHDAPPGWTLARPSAEDSGCRKMSSLRNHLSEAGCSRSEPYGQESEGRTPEFREGLDSRIWREMRSARGRGNGRLIPVKRAITENQ
ncbi:hypothetical protein DFP72DRAFT_1054079 [Ephemerocybe angulata]|uniref:Uncharacterized protein n=1 Tax=Ephemerocybe angulata TaxID=980116 RepID=A0A8H6HA62_9AGAR|nr:hypothetical protein DFP72DRAFT_1054079 [Tulosesus angulatus]